MKKILLSLKRKTSSIPFWQPWGAFGCLWRVLLFLLLLLLLIMMLSMIRSCDDKEEPVRSGHTYIPRHDLPNDILNPPGSGDNGDRGNGDRENGDRGNDDRGENGGENGGQGEDPDSGGYSDPDAPLPPDNRIPGNIEDPGPYLPPREDNKPTPVDPDKIIEDDDTGERIVSNVLNVILESSADDETYRDFANQFKAAYPGDDYKIAFYNTQTKLIQLNVPSEAREQVKQELPQKIQGISFRVFDESLFGSSFEQPNDPAFKYEDLSWYLAPIQAYEAWEITQGNPDVIVAIVDSYFDITHGELEASRIVSPYSVPLNSSDVRPSRDCPQDDACFWHGTSVASFAVGTINNESGLCGIAPKCRLMPISMGHQFTSMTMLQGIMYAIYQGADVVNISAGLTLNPIFSRLPIEEQIEFAKNNWLEGEEIWQFVYDLAERRNVTIVWAAGNENYFSALDFSKRGRNTIRVSAVDKTLERAEFSNYGNFEQYNCLESTISAPGTDLLCASPFNTYHGGGAGTSYSAPIVTGAIALMKSIDPTLSNSRIIEILQATGKPIAGSPEIGSLLQIKDALMMVNGQFTNFDDVMDNPELLIGTWQTVQDLHRVDASGNNYYEEKLKIYFHIPDTANAVVKIHEYVTSDNVYIAPAEIKWSTRRIAIEMQSDARSQNSSQTYMKNVYACQPDSANRMECSHEAFGITSRYMIKKISDNPNLDIKSYE